MNDTHEVRYFRETAKNRLSARISQKYGQELEQQFLTALGDNEYYAACFSGDEDDLYQWRGYGDEGRGFAIGFDPQVLCPHVPPDFHIDGIGPATAPMHSAVPNYSLGISQVIYASEEKLENYIAVLLDLVDIYPAEFNSISSLAILVNRFSAVIKNERFKAEQEWRLLYAPLISHNLATRDTEIIGPLKNRHWRVGRYGITPYFAYENVLKAIRCVVIGPVSAERDSSYLRDMLNSYGLLGKVGVSVSNITFR